MNPKAQQIAIAEACGWHVEIRNKSLTYTVLLKPSGSVYDSTSGTATLENFGCLPDYLDDLNAMHEAEMAIIEPPMVRYYATYLCTICENASPMVPVWNATAAQRAEAFLRTIGKWEESS